MKDIPTYEELKQIKEEKTYWLFDCLCGGYFRLTINEDGKHNIALDYLEDGYLHSIIRNFNSNYSFSILYKFNKKNYEGLVKLYKLMLETLLNDVKKELGWLDER